MYAKLHISKKNFKKCNFSPHEKVPYSGPSVHTAAKCTVSQKLIEIFRTCMLQVNNTYNGDTVQTYSILTPGYFEGIQQRLSNILRQKNSININF